MAPDDLALTRSRHAEGGPDYKRLFGSDLAFRDDGVLSLRSPGVGARPSYASAASATSGGRACCPTPTGTSAAGRSPRGELADGYRAALDFVPFAGEDDELAERYPLVRSPMDR